MCDYNLTVLVVEPGKKPYVKDIAPGVASLQKEVDGFFEVVYPFKEPVAIVCDGEGKLKGSEWNRVLRDDKGRIYDIVAGKFLVVGLDEDHFTSLREEDIKMFSEMYWNPELILLTNSKLLVIPIDYECA